MPDAIVFGVGSALLYGLTDYVARFANKANGVLRTLLWGQAFVAAILTVIVIIRQDLPHAQAGDWALLMIANVAIVSGTGCLYRGLARGRISVVAPVMASYGALGAILAVATGERLTPLSGLGLAFAALGAVVCATTGKAPSGETKAHGSGWVPAVCAAAFYAVGFWLQGRFSVPAFGPLAAMWLYYLSASAIVAIICLVRQKNPLPKDVKNLALILVTAILAGGGYAALIAGQALGKIAVVTALSSTSTAITVLLAFLFLKEKPGIWGGLGVLAVAGGVALVHLGGAS